MGAVSVCAVSSGGIIRRSVARGADARSGHSRTVPKNATQLEGDFCQLIVPQVLGRSRKARLHRPAPAVGPSIRKRHLNCRNEQAHKRPRGSPRHSHCRQPAPPSCPPVRIPRETGRATCVRVSVYQSASGQGGQRRSDCALPPRTSASLIIHYINGYRKVQTKIHYVSGKIPHPRYTDLHRNPQCSLTCFSQGHPLHSLIVSPAGTAGRPRTLQQRNSPS